VSTPPQPTPTRSLKPRHEPDEGPSTSSGNGVDLRATGDRINTLLEASAAGGVVARERAEELVRLVADLYGAGLERLLTIVHETGRLDDEVLAALAADDLVASLLLVHDLHPYDVTTRVEQALEGVRPYLGSHGGDVELLEVSHAGVVRLRLLGSCDGCASSSVTLKLAVEGAIEAAAPEVVGIEVETPAPSTGVAAGPVIPAGSLWSRVESIGLDADEQRATWASVPALDGLADGAVTSVAVGGTPVLGCRVGADLYAFVDRCDRCGESLADASLGRLLGGATGNVALRCSFCGTHFQVRRAGVCLESPELHLDPLPLLVDHGTASVAVPLPATA
jgi:Fe-S cluster biogenesis protein NfuA/nitrite reductase/ring-hydroxylating ferredoxin subunit